MNIQAVLLVISISTNFMEEYAARLKANGKVPANEIDDILKKVVIESLPGGELLFTLAEKLKDMISDEE